MLGYFNYKPFENKVLLTNDTGRYVFLDREEFETFISTPQAVPLKQLRDLKDNLFWTDESEEAFVREGAIRIRDSESYLLEGTSLFILAITNECNNKCVYCQAHGTAKMQRMSFETADRALERVRECPTKRITIEFQGGEPLANFRVIKHVVERAKTVLSGKEVSYTIVSNLSLLTDEIVAFVRENHISVSTSLDGPEVLHNINRPRIDGRGSYQDVIEALKCLSKNGIKAGAIQTTTKQSLSSPEAIVQIYLQLGFSHIFLRPLTNLGEASRNWNNIGYTANEFISFYKRALSEIIKQNLQGNKLVEYQAALFLSKILNGKAVNYMELRSPCGASVGQLAITSTGNVYTCDEGRMLAEDGDESFLLGNVYTSGYNEWLNTPCCKAVTAASLLESQIECCDCAYKPYCGICPVINHALNGNITKKAKERCSIYRGILDTLFEYLLKGSSEVLSVFSEWSDLI